MCADCILCHYKQAVAFTVAWCTPDVSEVIINHIDLLNSSELKEIVPTLKQKFDVNAEVQYGESVTKVAEDNGRDYKPHISNTEFIIFARN